MRLLLFHPGPSRIDCAKCIRYVHDMDTGELKQYRSGPKRELRSVERPKGQSPPCEKCPKESPQKAKQYELSAKNWRALWYYYEARAAGLTESDRSDRLLRRNLAILDRIHRQWEAHEAASQFARSIPWPKHK